MNNTLFGLALVFIALSFAACGNDRSCSIDADCFSGEYCSDEQCIVGTPAENVQDNNQSLDLGMTDRDGGTDSGTAPDMSADDDAEVPGTCQIDLFGNSCTDDEFEENDLYQQDLPIPIPQDSWCQNDALVTTSQSFTGTLCAGDQADLFRILIDNRSPNACLADTLTIRMTVEFETPCDPLEQIRVVPYLSFENPNSNSSCGQNDDLRCTVSDDQLTHTFEWVRNSEDLLDQRLSIEPREDDVQVSYTVTVDVIQ